MSERPCLRYHREPYKSDQPAESNFEVTVFKDCSNEAYSIGHHNRKNCNELVLDFSLKRQGARTWFIGIVIIELRS
jgi:hypothetical protein